MDDAELRALVALGLRDAETFRRLREGLGLGHDELGALLGASAERVAAWERGDEEPDAETWGLLERLVLDRLALRRKARDPGEWI